MTKIFLHGASSMSREVDLHVYLQLSGNLLLRFQDPESKVVLVQKYVKVEKEGN